VPGIVATKLYPPAGVAGDGLVTLPDQVDQPCLFGKLVIGKSVIRRKNVPLAAFDNKDEENELSSRYWFERNY
jgi:hypothetical protein